ncbi:MAG: RNA-binding transcriptional accessory protein [Planctomycetales bacterium]|nr:RNA-binding transcriptional accessory protein [Planctomycetales bacterium]
MSEDLWNELHLELLVQHLVETLSATPQQIRAAIELLEDGNTLPFIARYRMEATKGLDEIALRRIEDELHKAKELCQRKQTILKTIAEQGLLDDALRERILHCADKVELEDLYLPYKPKRRTRATQARERGLQDLADVLLGRAPLPSDKHEFVRRFVAPERDVPDAEAALQGACDIVAETWSEDAETRSWMAEQAKGFGQVVSKVKRGKQEIGEKFEAYFDHHEAAKRVPSHRLLAMKRGEADGVLRVGIQLDEEFTLRKLRQMLAPDRRSPFYGELDRTVEDCYERLLHPAAESTVLQALKEQADEEAIAVFAKNLRELLLAAPAGPLVTIGLDPGFRTGCKVAVVDGTGKFLENATIYPTPPRSDKAGAAQTLLELIHRHQVRLIAIGNGTASRETDAFVGELIREHRLDITKVMVNESGASIYSASELAAREYPDLDLTVRGAISIAHRLQDPLAELVKIDPKSIGVGQYQHDVNQTSLRKSLDREVESCVNSVGVDLNTASASLLAHVAGIGEKLAQRIVEYRDEHGRFDAREELLEVPKLGRKAFQQSAGFLRIAGGKHPLDDSAVHPESYYVVERMAELLGVPSSALVGNATLVGKLNAADFVDERTGLLTVQDILAELAKPGRDPRSEFRAAKFSEGVQQISDVKPGMILEGVITNVTHFGAFVDIGVHQDALIHISQLANQFVSDPSDVVSVGDVVKVKVLDVDVERKRISASRKQV